MLSGSEEIMVLSGSEEIMEISSNFHDLQGERYEMEVGLDECPEQEKEDIQKWTHPLCPVF